MAQILDYRAPYGSVKIWLRDWNENDIILNLEHKQAKELFLLLKEYIDQEEYVGKTKRPKGTT